MGWIKQLRLSMGMGEPHRDLRNVGQAYQGTIINVVNFEHPHFKSILHEGLWGFRDRGVNRVRWEALVPGQDVFIYGGFRTVKGIWLYGKLISKTEDHKASSYWIDDPQGFPLRIKIGFNRFRSLEDLEQVKPVLKSELGEFVPYLRTLQDHWALINFGQMGKKGVTYSFEQFGKVKGLYEAKNEVIPLDLS
ncbi:MAG: hypothetical protein QW057_05390, partial [Candidatus Bathyarchaeia archaeon]